MLYSAPPRPVKSLLGCCLMSALSSSPRNIIIEILSTLHRRRLRKAMKKGKVTVCRICCAATPARAGYWKNTVVFISLKKAKQQQKNLWQKPSPSCHTILLTHLAEQILLSCLSSWKFNGLPRGVHFLSKCRSETASEKCCG